MPTPLGRPEARPPLRQIYSRIDNCMEKRYRHGTNAPAARPHDGRGDGARSPAGRTRKRPADKNWGLYTLPDIRPFLVRHRLAFPGAPPPEKSRREFPPPAEAQLRIQAGGPGLASRPRLHGRSAPRQEPPVHATRERGHLHQRSRTLWRPANSVTYRWRCPPRLSIDQNDSAPFVCASPRTYSPAE